MANDIDAWKDLEAARKRKDKKGLKKIKAEIKRGDYGEEAKSLIVRRNK